MELLERRCLVRKYGAWERVNAIVLSCLMNVVSKSLLSGIAFASNAFDVWTDLKKDLIE